MDPFYDVYVWRPFCVEVSEPWKWSVFGLLLAVFWLEFGAGKTGGVWKRRILP